ncbi:MAG: YabP/YqfC family sporulation protein, partial [Clostridia bacterium]
MDDKHADLPHNIIIEGRARMSVSGVSDVESFDEGTVTLITTRGLLTIRGTALHIERLSLDTGELSVEGSIDGVQYSDEESGGGFWSRM